MQQPLQTEQQMLAELAKGNRSVTEQLYRRHFKIVSSWVLQNGGSQQDAGDIFQEAMVVLYEKSMQESFRLTCKIGTYLFAVSKHLWFHKLQKAKRQPWNRHNGLEIDEEAETRYAVVDDLESVRVKEMHFQTLDEALEQIGEPCKSLLKAFYHENMSMHEIATHFSYTNPDNAKTQKYKCLNRLRKIFHRAQAKLQ